MLSQSTLEFHVSTWADSQASRNRNGAHPTSRTRFVGVGAVPEPKVRRKTGSLAQVRQPGVWLFFLVSGHISAGITCGHRWKMRSVEISQVSALAGAT